MKKKKVIILSSIILVILLIPIIILIDPFNNDKKEVNNKEKVQRKASDIRKVIIASQEVKEEENFDVNDVTDEPKGVDTDDIKQDLTTITCPDNYVLNDNKCTSVVDPKLACPEGTFDYSYYDVPKGTYCADYSSGKKSDNNTCPDGYGLMKIVFLNGNKDSYQCLKLYEKEYTCDKGYTFIINSNKCSKTIDATQQ